MQERVAIFTGNFDPPHKGHMALVRSALETGHFDRIVIKVVPNISKTRLLTEKNSIAMLKVMVPADIAARVTIDETDMKAENLVRHYNAAVVRGRRKAEHPHKDFISEMALVAYFAAASMVHLKRPTHIEWIRPEEGQPAYSSTKVRKILFSDDCTQEKLEEFLSSQAAAILIKARQQSPQPFTQESADAFNIALQKALTGPHTKRNIISKNSFDK